PNGTKALNELVISESSGHLVGIMGASGSGKTTLLTLLSGQERPSNGQITINDIDLNSNNSDLKGAIGYVPQDDLLIEDLTVYQNLYYNARLCFKDLDEKEISIKISRTLISLGLDEIKDIKVGTPLNKKISGGQRKRLNIALELIREPLILFLDEPTSGLSSRDSENVMDLLKEITIKGKLVFVVIHQPSSDIFKMFDKLLILDTGGYPAFYGNPIESVMYFKKVTNQINSEVGECYACGSVNPETIFNLMELKEIDEYGNYTTIRKIKPNNFYELYREKFLNKTTKVEATERIKTVFNVPGRLIQTKYFFLRDFFAKISNKQYVLINLLEVPALALFLSLIIRFIDKSKGNDYSYYHNYNIPAYFFMAIVAAMLVGLTISAEEIYKDQKILKREKFLHLSRLSYLLSKIVLLFMISLIQAALFVIIGNLVLRISFNYFHLFLVLFSIFCFSNLLGLLLSSSFNSPVTIYIIIPLVIIPQMLLGGAMFNFNKLNEWFGGGHKVPLAANFMISRWAYEGIMVDMYANNDYEKDRFDYNKLESNLNYKLVYLFPKLDELVLYSDSIDTSKRSMYTKIIKNEIVAGIDDNKKFGFTIPLPDFVDLKKVAAYIKEMKAFYNDKLISISNLKEQQVQKLIKENGGARKDREIKSRFVNNQLEETVTASLEKEKIAVSDDKLVQVIDPVYLDPITSNKIFGLNAHFFSPVKYLFNYALPTYYFNLLVIWLINLVVFIVLYFDLLKRLLNKFS
ncbi:MAG: ATP-binding cassette domain-containing protein, partial [Bacteroidia bacterium]